jgi:putative ABC transport system ATP-binding protein
MIEERRGQQVKSSLPVYELTDVSKYREQGGVAFELKIPALTVPRGAFVALVGPSGCGKSTLLDLLALVLRPTQCKTFQLCIGHPSDLTDVKMVWENADEAILAHLRRNYLGYVLQTGGLLPFLTGAQNILLPVRIRRMAGGEARMLRMAEQIGVAEFLHKKPQYLSGGQRQRVAVLRALVHDPIIVLADEPTAAVDRQRAQAIIEDFRVLATEAGTSIVMATHDGDLVVPLADRIYTFRVTQVETAFTQSVCVPVS